MKKLIRIYLVAALLLSNIIIVANTIAFREGEKVCCKVLEHEFCVGSAEECCDNGITCGPDTENCDPPKFIVWGDCPYIDAECCEYDGEEFYCVKIDNICWDLEK